MHNSAIKLSVLTIESIMLWLPTDQDLAKFAFACLTSTYNGENWYYIKPDTDESWDVDYTKQIVTEEKLKTEWDCRFPQDNNLWFKITKK